MFVASYLTEVDHLTIVNGESGNTATELAYGFTCAVSGNHSRVLEATLAKLAVEVGDIFAIPAEDVRALFHVKCTAATSEYECEFLVEMGECGDAVVVIQRIDEC